MQGGYPSATATTTTRLTNPKKKRRATIALLVSIAAVILASAASFVSRPPSSVAVSSLLPRSILAGRLDRLRPPPLRLGSSAPPPSAASGAASRVGTEFVTREGLTDAGLGTAAPAGWRRSTGGAAVMAATTKNSEGDVAAAGGGDFASFLYRSSRNLPEPPSGGDGDAPSPGFHVIMGNEAGDADSIVSALALGYVRGLGEEGGRGGGGGALSGRLVVPIVSVHRADLSLRRDVVVLLDAAGINPDQLLYLDDDAIAHLLLPQPLAPSTVGGDGVGSYPKKAETTTITLVDHNRIRSSLSGLASAVTEIVDHHDDEEAHASVTPESGMRTIAFEDGRATVASACTLVAERLLRRTSGATKVDGRLGLLLLGVILLDSVNMLPAAGKGTPRDAAAMADLLRLSDWMSLGGTTPSLADADALGRAFPEGLGRGPPEPTALFELLSGAKNDPRFWSEMSGTDCLRIDYKKFVVRSPPSGSSSGAPPPVSSIGLSSVLIDLDSLLSKDGFLDDLAAFADSADVDMIGILSVHFVEDVPRRELLLAGRDDLVVSSFAEHLIKHPGAAFLEIEERDGIREHGGGGDWVMVNGLHVRAFRQGNGRGSRKQVAPVLLRHASAMSSRS